MNKYSYLLIMNALAQSYERLMNGSNTEDELNAVKDAIIEVSTMGFTE